MRTVLSLRSRIFAAGLAVPLLASADDRPNILFCFSDDWGRYASIYRDPDRPEFELYDLRKDPDQINNVANDPEFADALENLSDRLLTILTETEDPRVLEDGSNFDRMPFVDPNYVHERREKKELPFQ